MTDPQFPQDLIDALKAGGQPRHKVLIGQTDSGKVQVVFQQAVKSFEMPPEEAEKFGAALVERARRLMHGGIILPQ